MSEENEVAAVAGKAATVIIVIEAVRGDYARERHYIADRVEHSPVGDMIEVYRDGRRVALYPHGSWMGYREHGAEVPDGTARALAAAKRTLKQIAQVPPDEISDKLRQVAQDALEEIWAETEL